MKPADILQVLAPWRARQTRTAWKPIVRHGEDPARLAQFGGLPWTGPEAPWPACGCCQKPLPLFLQLNLDDLPPDARHFGSGLLQLFYCTRDSCQGMGGWEPFEDRLSRVRIIRVSGPPAPAPALARPDLLPARQITGWTALADLPSPEEHPELGLKYHYDFPAGTLRIECPEVGLDTTDPIDACPAETIALSQAGDKLGGWPHWIQGLEYPRCPRCGQRMMHLFQVDSEDNVPFMWGDAGCGHITQCPEHREVVAFGWACG